jgi:acyl CoA:acetate/3-ketoacid CoA transferase
MNQRQYARRVKLLNECSPETILKAADRCDGHGILKPEAFVDAGLPAAVIHHLTRTYKSDGSPKGTIFVQGEPVKELSGVYGLDMLRFLASALGVEYAPALGRGLEARRIQAALHQHFSRQRAPS